MKTNNDIFDHFKKREIETPSKDYFNQLADRVIAESAPASVPLFRKIIYITSAAAAVFMLGFYILNGTVTSEENVLAELENIPREDLMAYVDEHIDEFDTDLIVEMIHEDDLVSVELNSTVEDPVEDQTNEPAKIELDLEDIDREDILKYLELEDVDLENLEDSFI